MLHPQPEKRATAHEMLKHPWLNKEDKIDVKMSDEEHKNYLTKRKRIQDLMGAEFQAINEDHFVKEGGRFDKNDKFDNI